MARATTIHVCSGCGHSTPRWQGKCPGCGEWNTMVEEAAPAAAAAAPGGRRGSGGARPATPVPLAHVSAAPVPRLLTGIGEFDRVLGGGIVPGSLVLLGGSPGIGKSTLTNMALGNLAGAGRRTLYVSGEESAAQIRLRAERLAGSALDVPVIAETDLDVVVATLEAEQPEVVVIDSVQTLHASSLSGAPGSVGQVREVAARVMDVAKRLSIAVLLVGHVTKEGSLAGPRVLEHLVDCVLQFEGERERTYRTLRALKNRFGSTNEVGVFEMRSGGLVEVLDASARFVGEATKAPGSVVLASMEGSRPLLVEVQALVSPSELVPPRRVVNGLDRNRLALVLAVLSRHAGVGVGTADVFVNVVGGVRVDEPGADLAIALAVASAAKGVAMEGGPAGRAAAGRAAAGRSGAAARDASGAAAARDASGATAARDASAAVAARDLSAPSGGGASGVPLVAFGEVGLTGEIRSVGHPDRRREEAAKFGLPAVLGPPDSGGRSAATVREAIKAAFGGALRAAA